MSPEIRRRVGIDTVATGTLRPPVGGGGRRRIRGESMAKGLDRRRFLLGAAATAGLAAVPLAASGCAPKPTIDAARNSLAGLWDAAVPGTYHGVVEDWLAPGVPAPGAEQAHVQEWIEAVAGTLPPPLDGITDWFLRAWAADLDLWADTFHWPLFDGGPSFGDLPLGPSITELGRQYKVKLMMALFDGPLDIKYFLAMAMAKVGFYCDGWYHLTGQGEPVGSRYIGFPGAVGSAANPSFSYRRPVGTPDARLGRTAGGLVVVP